MSYSILYKETVMLDSPKGKATRSANSKGLVSRPTNNHKKIKWKFDLLLGRVHPLQDMNVSRYFIGNPVSYSYPVILFILYILGFNLSSIFFGEKKLLQSLGMML